MEFLSSFVQQVVSAIYEATRMIGEPSYGLAIIIMTILIKLLLYPLTKRQIASTKAMSRIQPRMKELQMRYRDDKMKLNEELSKLYKKEGVNPLAGCLPLVIQIPLDAEYRSARSVLYPSYPVCFDDLYPISAEHAAVR